jgi:hypothetical protein
MRTRAGHRHVLFENIEELWQLVNVGAAQKCPNFGDRRAVASWLGSAAQG